MRAADDYEEQTRRLLAETTAAVELAKAEIRERQEKLAVLEAEASAYETALQGYFKRTGRQTETETKWDSLLKDQVHREQILTIAKQKGGTVEVSKVTDLLFGQRFIKAKKRATAYTMIQRLLSEMIKDGRFTKLSPGRYRLNSCQEP